VWTCPRFCKEDPSLSAGLIHDHHACAWIVPWTLRLNWVTASTRCIRMSARGAAFATTQPHSAASTAPSQSARRHPATLRSAHSSQLTAHSSQLTAHSSQLATVGLGGGPRKEDVPIMTPQVSATMRPHLRAAYQRCATTPITQATRRRRAHSSPSPAAAAGQRGVSSAGHSGQA
jgi:hypothetical protein